MPNGAERAKAQPAFQVGQVVIVRSGYRIARVLEILATSRGALYRIRITDGMKGTQLRTLRASEIRAEWVCVRCGCRDSRPCSGGCWWANSEPPVCSSCMA